MKQGDPVYVIGDKVIGSETEPVQAVVPGDVKTLLDVYERGAEDDHVFVWVNGREYDVASVERQDMEKAYYIRRGEFLCHFWEDKQRSRYARLRGWLKEITPVRVEPFIAPPAPISAPESEPDYGKSDFAWMNADVTPPAPTPDEQQPIAAVPDPEPEYGEPSFDRIDAPPAPADDDDLAPGEGDPPTRPVPLVWPENADCPNCLARLDPRDGTCTMLCGWQPGESSETEEQPPAEFGTAVHPNLTNQEITAAYMAQHNSDYAKAMGRAIREAGHR